MKKIAFITAIALVLCLTGTAEAVKNWNAKFQLHYAGAHDAKVNTCSFEVTDCGSDIVVDGGAGGQGADNSRFDIYVIAIDTEGIAGLRYGITCIADDYFFYGWTKCSDLEIPTDPWPACGGGNAQTWGFEKPGGHITVGIIDVYVYGTATTLCTAEDPRVGFAEWCDGSSPEPFCNKTNEVAPAVKDLYFGCVGFNGTSGVSRCDVIATEKASWGAIKALYR